jgi:glycosyltransferase involved in cell wall biosynthesis
VPIRGFSASAASTLNSRKVDPAGPLRSDSSPRRRKRVGFVVQRCGLEVNGGAESLCLQIAQRMAVFWETEVLTTCARDYMTWENFYPEGIEEIGSTMVRRFPVDHPRDVPAFDNLSAELHSRRDEAPLAEQEKWMRAQGPMSCALLDHLRGEKDSYDAFIFFGYLYATTYFGLPLVADRAWLEPLAHDEWTIYLGMWDGFFSLPTGFIFNTAAERNFVQRRFPRNHLPGPIAGVGITPPAEIDVQEFKARYHLSAPFLLYVGRIDESKGCGTMFEYFIRWKKETALPHKLVLLGKEVMAVPFHDDIIHLGFVGEAEKWAAMKGCDWLLMPSPNESLSMALLETWSVGRPALVTARSEVLAAHCQESHGGLWYEDFEEWSAALAIADEETKQVLGRQGKAYVEQCYSWDRVERSYLEALTPRL